MTSLVECPKLLGHDGMGQHPLVFINFTVGSSLADNLTAHLSCREGAFWWLFLRASQYTWGCDISWSVSILCHSDRRVILKVLLSIEHLRFLETLSPIAVFLFPSEDVVTLVKSLQCSSWMLWDLVVMNPASWYSFHFYFGYISHSTCSVDHMYRDPFLLSWCTFTCLQNHVRGYFRVFCLVADMM